MTEASHDQLASVVRQHAGQLAAALMRVTTGARAAMAELADLADILDEYHLYHASRAEFLRELGHPDQARAADRRAIELTTNPAEQAVLQQRLTWI